MQTIFVLFCKKIELSLENGLEWLGMGFSYLWIFALSFPIPIFVPHFQINVIIPIAHQSRFGDRGAPPLGIFGKSSGDAVEIRLYRCSKRAFDTASFTFA
jgi:hypothetical protein